MKPAQPSRPNVFRLSTLLIVVLFVALFLGGLRRPSEVWLVGFATTTFFALGISIVGAILFHGTNRAFWIGFAVLGWMRALVEYEIVSIHAREMLLPNLLFYEWANTTSDSQQQLIASLIIGHMSILVSGLIGGVLAAVFYSFPAGSESDGRR